MCDQYGQLKDGFLQDDVALDFCGNQSVIDACLSKCQVLRCDELGKETSPENLAIEVITKVLTFLLVGGFAATVDHRYFYENFKTKSVYLGVACQFFIMPALGFCSVAIFNTELKPLYAIILLVVTACPGGAYSNWFCSVFNGDLALSVAMTSCSTILAAMFLPLNVFIYVNIAYDNLREGTGQNVVELLPYDTLFITLGLVIAAVLSGLYFGYKLPQYQHHANFVGNVAGILMQIVSVFASSTSCAPPWEQDLPVFAAVAFPLVIGVIVAFLVSSCASLPKPQQFAIAIETAYQNIAIAAGIALSLGSQGREAAVIPVLYGFFEAIVYFTFCFTAVFSGWTLSPKGEYLWKVLLNDYQDTIATHPLYESFNKEHHLGKQIDHFVDDDESSKEDEIQGRCSIFGFWLF